MIQRIQSLYLLLAAACLVLFVLVASVWIGGVSAEFAWLGPVAYGLGLVTALAALVSVFLYRDRKRQRSVIVATMWLDLLLVAAVLGGLLASTGMIEESGAAVPAIGPYGRYLVGLLPVAAYLFLRLARAGVHKDIQTVRSMDRLR